MLDQYCCTLRTRDPWSKTLSRLTNDQRLRISCSLSPLGTHDILLCPNIQSDDSPDHGVLRFLLVNTKDMIPEHSTQVLDRIRRLVDFAGDSKGIAVVFFLGETGPSSIGLQSMVSLQSTLIKTRLQINILPLPRIQDLPALLQRYKISSECYQERPQVPTTVNVLPYLVVKEALNDHTVNVVTDITESLKDLVVKLGSTQGQDYIGQYLEDDTGRSTANAMAEFWMEEYIAE
ncbi:MAG: hypothetical protein M1814_006722 [Vezdaea aestivalis]|nr:MAG: hypothetical protein M1814_006722 [Vezdaea aestivalis]